MLSFVSAAALKEEKRRCLRDRRKKKDLELNKIPYR
jgi:hypothetical protein